MTLIKICGITTIADAVNAAELGVDMLGFVFYPRSKRYVTPCAVRDIVNELPSSIVKVGVFVDEKYDDVIAIAEEAGLTALQFHGNESPEYCAAFAGKYKIIKAFRVKEQRDLRDVNIYPADYYMLDTYIEGAVGGTGKAFDWKVLKDFEILKPMILSGGLTPDTVDKAIREIAPFGVDVSSGVEKEPGKKDLERMKKFVQNVRKVS